MSESNTALQAMDKDFNGKFFCLKVDDNGLAICVFDDKEEKVNKLSKDALLELEAIADHLAIRNEVKMLLFKSGKTDNFIAGADINQIREIDSERDAEEKSIAGQTIINKVSSLKMKKIAAIRGACVGGGLELALAFDIRIASDHKKTKIGLPEVQLGIIPGFGGTQRLPRLIGLPKALPLILSGKLLPADKAYKQGIIDYIVADEFFDLHVDKIVNELLQGSIRSYKKSVKFHKMDKLLSLPLVRNLVFSKATKDTLKKTKGKYPAILKALEVVKEGYPLDLEEGLKTEAAGFGAVAYTEVCKNLIQLFFTNEDLKKERGADSDFDANHIKKVGVLGAGIMGGGIAWLLSYKDYITRIKDISWEAIGQGYSACREIYDQLLKKRRISKLEVQYKIGRTSGNVEFTGFHDVDYVIEAIVENIEIKKSAFRELEEKVTCNTIIASNTSALSITEMGHAFSKPERFIGMHFFNPVNRMPLVEVIPGEKTSPDTIALTVDLVKKLGKTPIVVKDVPGFLVNRILIPYVNEAIFMLQQGAEIEMVDEVLLDYGMPMGPFELADNVGLDVGYKVAKHLELSYGERMKAPEFLEVIHKEDGLLGKKTGRGFFVHKGREKSLNSNMVSLASKFRRENGINKIEFQKEEILDRCILALVNESVRCLDEKVVKSAAFLDMALIMGTGFPPFVGGPLRQADSWGVKEVKDKLDKYAKSEGIRFECSGVLKEYASLRKTFY